MQNQINDGQTSVFAPGELDYYASLEEPESSFFAGVLTRACGRGPWKKLCRWLLANTRHDCNARDEVCGYESSIVLFIVQAWATRFGTAQQKATAAEMSHVEQCVYLAVRHLRLVAPDAVRKAMGNDD